VDFADVRTIMTDAGSSLMGIGTASGNIILSLPQYIKMYACSQYIRTQAQLMQKNM
jgi:cell division GTPase FtsZ